MIATPQTASDHVSPGGTESADRVADILLKFGAAVDPLGISEVARSLGLSKAVVHRVVQSLCSRSLLRAATGGGHTLGPAAFQLSMRAWDQVNLVAVAAPILRRLRDSTRETTTLSALVGRSRVYLDQYESPEEIKMVVEIGPQFPLHSGASSRSILAFLPRPFVDEAIGDLRALNPDFNESTYRGELEEIVKNGYAISMNERGSGAASIAAPFFDAAGSVRGSISASGPVARFRESKHDEQIRQVRAAASEISRRIALDGS